MPELPEAETITRALNRTLKKRKIKKVEIFAPKLRTPLGPLCTAKLEGRAFTGIGNIYAAETLFACGIRPQRPASRLTRSECDAIVREAKRILRLAIKWGGTTVHDFRSVDGSEGKFVQKLKIYAQKQCPVCGTAVAKMTLGGRTSWYCPKCQK